MTTQFRIRETYGMVGDEKIFVPEKYKSSATMAAGPSKWMVIDVYRSCESYDDALQTIKDHIKIITRPPDIIYELPDLTVHTND